MRHACRAARSLLAVTVCLFAICADNVHAQPQPTGSNLVVVVDQPRDGTANNVRVFSDATSASFTFPQNLGVFNYTLTATRPGSTFSGAFQAPGFGLLTPGTYVPMNLFAQPTDPGMYISYSPACNGSNVTGRKFIVHEVAYDGAGSISKLALDFADECYPYASGAARVFGHVRIQSVVPINYNIDAPVPFVLSPVTGAALSSWIVSNEVTITGINVPVAVTVAGGEYSIDGGAFTAAPGTLVAGQRIRMRFMSAALPNQLTQGTLSVGSITNVFKVGTATGDFPQPSGDPLIVLIRHPVSETDLITTKVLSRATDVDIRVVQDGYLNSQTSVRAYWANGNNFTASLEGANGSQLGVGNYPVASAIPSAALPSLYSNEAGCTLPDGNLSLNVLEIEIDASNTVTKLAVDFAARCTVSAYQSQSAFYGHIRFNSTVPIDYTITLPTPFAFAKVGSLPLNSLVESNEITLRGITVAVPISIVGGEYSIDGGAYTAAPGSAMAGQRIRVRMYSPAVNNRTATATLTVGGRSVPFTTGSDPGNAPQPIADPLIVLLRQAVATGAMTQIVLSPATNAVLGFPQTSYYSENMIAVSGVVPNVYDDDHRWFAQLTGPNQQPLTAGAYTTALNAPVPTAKFEVSTAPCGSIGYTIRFVVHEIEYEAPLKPSKLAMDFVQLCRLENTEFSAVIGYVRINSTIPIDYSIRQPVQFSFPMVIGAAPGAALETSELTVRGVNVPVAVTATGGEYRIDDGPYVSTPGVVVAGQRIRFRVTAPAIENAVTSGTLNVGDGSATFRVATRTGINPQANGAPLAVFLSQRTDQAGLGRSWYLSPANQSQFELTRNQRGGATLSIVTPSVQYPGSYESWYLEFAAANSLPLAPGAYPIAVRFGYDSPPATQSAMQAQHSPCFGVPFTASFTVHEITYSATGVEALALDFVQYCSSTTDPLYGYIRINSNVPINQIVDTSPTPFGFLWAYGVVRNQWQVSNSAEIKGLNAPAPISITNGEYSIDNGPFTAAPGTVLGGQAVRVRLLSSSAYTTRTSVILNVGGFNAEFSVTTEAMDFNPDSFYFAPVLGAPPGQWILSEVWTPINFNAPANIVVSGGEYSIAGRPFTSAQGTISPGESVRLRLMTPQAYNTATLMYVDIGSFNPGRGYFNVITLRRFTLTTLVMGGGAVTVLPAGSHCQSSCSVTLDENTVVTLTAQPNLGQQFVGWSGGGCSGTGTCTITMAASQNVQANFAGAPPAAPTITSIAPGDGLAIISFTTVPRATLYQAACTPGTDTVTSTTSPIVFTPLTNGLLQTCTVTALNQFGGTASAPVTVTPNPVAALALLAVSSRKLHSAANGNDMVFDLPLPLGATAPIVVEPRVGSSAGHLLVFTFNRSVTSVGGVSVLGGSGASLGAASAATIDNRIELTLPPLPDRTRAFVTITGVNSSLDVGTVVGFLRGDVNGSGAVGDDDVRTVRSRVGQALDSGTFKYDINLSGTISATDIVAVKTRIGITLLP